MVSNFAFCPLHLLLGCFLSKSVSLLSTAEFLAEFTTLVNGGTRLAFGKVTFY